MAFVPEGQADSSQARSAWVAMQRAPVPEGRSKSLSVPEKAEIRSIVPLGRGYFPHDSRHFVPGYDHAVPLGQKTFSPPRLRIKLALMGLKPWAESSSPSGLRGNKSPQILLIFVPFTADPPLIWIPGSVYV